jgi:hypothetical protein
MRGLIHLTLNLAKPRSVDISSQPGCKASAARCASDTRVPSAWPSTNNGCNTAQCRSVGCVPYWTAPTAVIGPGLVPVATMPPATAVKAPVLPIAKVNTVLLVSTA